ncbi:MAG: aldehyde ferredoxin oxidoreductase family protein [Candidatus Bathyarchaeia archaeon]
MLSIPGYAGFILDVDLSKNRIEKRNLTKDLVYEYLGGRGFSSRLVCSNVKPKISPFSPDNVLVIAPGALVGTPTWSANRYTVCAKSPLGIFGWSSSGGHWAPELKFAGYDVIMIRGKAKKPVYLWIANDQLEIRNAEHLWGKCTYDVVDIIRKDVGNRSIETIAIGPAGENLVRFASIVTVGRIKRAAGRSGMGAIMGSKNLKAISVEGEKSLEVAKPNEVEMILNEILQILESDKHSQITPRVGSWFLVDSLASNGALVTKNGQQGNFELERNIGSESFLNKLLRATACFLCPLRCGRFVKIESGTYAGYVGKGPEFESIGMLGANLGVGDPDALIIASNLCDQYGLDTISTGSVISFAMECYQRGILTEEELNGLKLDWGNIDVVLKLAEMIAKREGIGNVLAEGVKKASGIVGKSSEKYALHVKGLEIIAGDPRGQFGFALGYAVSSRGGDHLMALPVFEYTGDKEMGVKLFGSEESSSRFGIKGKGRLVKWQEDLYCAINSLGVCNRTYIDWKDSYKTILKLLDKLVNLYNAITGLNLNKQDLFIVGERIVNIERMFNVREGITRKDDTLPKRHLEEPFEKGNSAGRVVPIEPMLNEYYEARGWDKKMGNPLKSKIKELNIE